MSTKITMCDCGHPPTPTSGIGTGYATDNEDKTYCYACCAENDKEFMRKEGRIYLYVSYKDKKPAQVINWPGTLRIDLKRHKYGKHSAFGVYTTRIDVWFEFEGEQWYGVAKGCSNDVCRCRKLKGENNG
jgi:hypothetical protein